jgi:hypothetical protein
MGSFIYVQYQGEDAGAIVAHMLVTEDEPQQPDHNITSKIEKIVGFQPNEPEPEDEDEDEDD